MFDLVPCMLGAQTHAQFDHRRLIQGLVDRVDHARGRAYRDAPRSLAQGLSGYLQCPMHGPQGGVARIHARNGRCRRLDETQRRHLIKALQRDIVRHKKQVRKMIVAVTQHMHGLHGLVLQHIHGRRRPVCQQIHTATRLDKDALTYSKRGRRKIRRGQAKARLRLHPHRCRERVPRQKLEHTAKQLHTRHAS